MRRTVTLALAALLLCGPLALRADAYGESGRGARGSTGRAAQIKAALSNLPGATARGAKDFARFLKTQRGHAFLGAVLLGSAMIYQGYSSEVKNGYMIPLAFSELTEIKAAAKAAGIPESKMAMTLALGEGNEMYMKGFEAWNLAHSEYSAGNWVNNFAFELRNKWEKDTHEHTLPALVKAVPERVKAALPLLEAARARADAMAPVVASAESAWSYSSHPNYEWVTVDDYGTDKDGHRVKTGSHQEQRIKDYTHDFTYDPTAGNRTSTQLDQALATLPGFQLPETLRVSDKTHAQGDWAADRSHGNADGSKRMSKEELVANAASFATGSTYYVNLKTLEGLWNTDLIQDASSWRSEKHSARTRSYTTLFSTHSGPQEYQTVERLKDHAQAVRTNVNEVISSLHTLAATAPRLEQLVKDILAIEIDGTKTGDSEKLAKEFMDVSRSTYAAVYKQGIDPKEVRAWVVAVWAVGGIAAGGGLGWGVVPGLAWARGRRRPGAAASPLADR